MELRQIVIIVLALVVAGALGLWLGAGAYAQAPPLPGDAIGASVSPVAPTVMPEPTPMCVGFPSGEGVLCYE